MATNEFLVNEMVEKYGEEVRSLVSDALQFLDQHESSWKLKQPVDRRAYLIDLIKEAGKNI